MKILVADKGFQRTRERLVKRKKNSSIHKTTIDGTPLNLVETQRIHQSIKKIQQKPAQSRNFKVMVSAPFYYDGSFGTVGRGIAEALHLNGIAVGAKVWDEGDRKAKLKPIIKKIVSKRFNKPNVYIRVSHPDSFDQIPTGFRVGVGVTEERYIRYQSWIRGCEKVDKIWVPSTFCQNAFATSGINTEVIPNGIDQDIFNPEIKPYNYNTDKFVFLFLGVAQRRKGTKLLKQAFMEEFEEGEATLVIKTLPRSACRSERSDILVIKDSTPAEEMGSFYTGADCYVLPTRGEGFGMPILEAMACKCPVIVTNYSGHLDFCNNKNSFLIECDHYNSPLFTDKYDYTEDKSIEVGAQPNKEHLKQLMRYVFENRIEKPVLKKIENAYNTAIQYTWENIGKIMLRSLSQSIRVPYFPVKQFGVEKKTENQITYYDPHCGDAFSMVGLENRRMIKDYYNIKSFSTAKLSGTVRDTAEMAILHPVLYFHHSISKLRDNYNIVGGFDVSDATSLSTQGVNYINLLDFIVLPTQFCAQVYQKSGVKIPIYVCPHSLREEFYQDYDPLFDLNNKPNVLFFNIRGDIRKGADITKYMINRYHEKANFIIRGAQMENSYRIGHLSNEDLVRLYDACDIIFCPSRGGGFELNVLEGMSRGLISLTSDWPSIVEYSAPLSLNIKSRGGREVIPGNPYYKGPGANPAIEDCVKQFDYILDNFNELKLRAEENAPLIREKYSRIHVGKIMKNIIGDWI